MIIRTLLAALMLTALSAPALAGGCPVRVAKIDQLLAEITNLSDTQVAEVKALRDDGENMHKSGKHGDSMATLGKALEILGAN
ncbi:MAG: hypothetical protein IH906_00155 [Proteobacteria bacterium]|nr:hypothetical protein [Pseudomonadota bacterium]